MNLSIVCGAIGAAISCYGAIRYYRAIIERGAQPNVASWIAWTLSWIILLIGAVNEASVVAQIFTGVGAIRSTVVIILAKAKGRRCIPRGHFECLSLASALVCLVGVAAFSAASLPGALLAASANFVATLPSVHQAWRKPYLDSPNIFIGNALACLIVCFGIILEDNASFVTASGPVVSLIGNCTVVAVLCIRRKWSPLIKSVPSHALLVELE